MADKEGNLLAKDYHLDVPACIGDFYVKGMGHCDWGMQNRRARICRPDGKTVMLAFDHGYIMGSTAGLERLDVVIPPLIPYVDVLMATRGGFRFAIPSAHDKGIALRVSAGGSVLQDDMSMEDLAVDVEDAIRMNASCMAVQVFIGSAGQRDSLANLNEAVNLGNRYGIPVLGVTAVGKEMERTTRYFMLATRMVAEMGAQIIKTYYCDEFEKVVAASPVPIVIAGGKKIPEADALDMAYRAISDGAAGVDMGRNIFQSKNPIAMTKAIAGVVHGGMSASEAYAYFEHLCEHPED